MNIQSVYIKRPILNQSIPRQILKNISKQKKVLEQMLKFH